MNELKIIRRLEKIADDYCEGYDTYAEYMRGVIDGLRLVKAISGRFKNQLYKAFVDEDIDPDDAGVDPSVEYRDKLKNKYKQIAKEQRKV